MVDTDALIDLLQGGGTTVNVKFFRGSRDIITSEEFRREIHSALMQKKMRTATVTKNAPASKHPKIDLREFVAAL